MVQLFSVKNGKIPSGGKCSKFVVYFSQKLCYTFVDCAGMGRPGQPEASVIFLPNACKKAGFLRNSESGLTFRGRPPAFPLWGAYHCKLIESFRLNGNRKNRSVHQSKGSNRIIRQETAARDFVPG